MYVVFRVDPAKKAQVDEALQDDLVSRQSIALRDARALGSDLQGTLVLIDGTDAAVKRAEELFAGIGEKLPAAKAEETYRLFKREEEDVASGVGFLFGG